MRNQEYEFKCETIKEFSELKRELKDKINNLQVDDDLKYIISGLLYLISNRID